MIFASNFVYAELGWIVINCRFIICKGSALINRSCLKRGLRGELACQQILLAPNQRPHQSQNWHPPTPPSCPLAVFSQFASACSNAATVHRAAREPTDWRRYFGINFCYLWILGRHDMVIIVSLVPTLRIARCQFVPTKLMIYYRPIKMYLVRFWCLRAEGISRLAKTDNRLPASAELSNVNYKTKSFSLW